MQAVKCILTRRASSLCRADVRGHALPGRVQQRSMQCQALRQGSLFAQFRASPSDSLLPATGRLGVRTHAVQANVVDPTSLTADGSEPTWRIRMLYDGDCPLCMREVNFLRDRVGESGTIDFVDIATADYTAERNAGLTFEQAMGEIHAILPDGSVVTKVEVFRRLYEAVGLGWVYAVTKVPAVGRAADAVYDVWAKYRLPITGRPGLLEVMRTREEEGCRPAREAAAAATATTTSSADRKE
eukprot:jgi/Ulvmu1/1642/UM114_0009.1